MTSRRASRRVPSWPVVGSFGRYEGAGESVILPDNNLPFQLTNLVGREREIGEVGRLLAEARLLTLTGPGGCGKTRLALAVAARVLEGFEDGVWLVELASLWDPDLVPQAVASVLGVREAPGTTLTESLTDYLRSRKTLLLLDNCEHFIDASASLAEALLRSCPNLSILVTSREALGVPGEIFSPSLLCPCQTPATCRLSMACPTTRQRGSSSSGRRHSGLVSRSQSETLWPLRRCATASTGCPLQ